MPSWDPDHVIGADSILAPAGRVQGIAIADAAAQPELRAAMESAGIDAHVANPDEALAGPDDAQIVLIDCDLPEHIVAPLIASLKARYRCPCVLVATAPSGEVLTLASRADVDAIVVRPIEPTMLRRLFEPMLGSECAPGAPLPSRMIGSSAPMRELWRWVVVAARSTSSVVITGETGVGKEVVARALHCLSGRRSAPFVAVNCAALPEGLLESELFGHERGSFTGAHTRHRGRFELADGGTLFLDEIGDLPLSLQVKLLRVLQERSFERVGGTESVSVDVRVIAATHHDLDEAVRERRFRADLFYRLNVLSLRVPSLRERGADVLALWDHLLSEGCARERRAPLTTSPAVQRLLLRHPWPGNVRELQNVALHALTVSTGGVVLPENLPDAIAARTSTARSRSKVGLTLSEIERDAILETYEAIGTVKGTAEMLGISTRKVQYRLKEYRRARGCDAIEPTLRARILLAEDDDELRWALTELLHADGHEVIPVADGRAALEHFGDPTLERGGERAHLVLSDVRMPGLNGMELLEHLRARGWTTPIVLMSAFGDDAMRRRASALGATAFLDKPIDVSHLQRLLELAS